MKYPTYITLKPITSIFDYKYRIRYYYREEVKKIEQIKHPVVRESLKLFRNKSSFYATKNNYFNLSFCGNINLLASLSISILNL